MKNDPSNDPSNDFPNVASISNHPLIAAKLTEARSTATTPENFRKLMADITILLIYEATLFLKLKSKNIVTPLKGMIGHEIAESLALVPILRAGLIMSDVASNLLPRAPVVHIGFRRNENTLEATNYFEAQLSDPDKTTCFVLDPMLATGGTAHNACETLERWGVNRIIYIGIVGAPEGLQFLSDHHPNIKIHLGALDSHLNENGYIVPGLGDAGDRLFGTG